MGWVPMAKPRAEKRRMRRKPVRPPASTAQFSATQREPDARTASGAQRRWDSGDRREVLTRAAGILDDDVLGEDDLVHLPRRLHHGHHPLLAHRLHQRALPPNRREALQDSSTVWRGRGQDRKEVGRGVGFGLGLGMGGKEGTLGWGLQRSVSVPTQARTVQWTKRFCPWPVK